MNEKPIVLYTDHSINRKISSSFAKGINGKMFHVNQFSDYDKPIAIYGFLRGLGEAIKKSKNFWYIDHGYFKPIKRSFINNTTVIQNYDGYFRIVHNNYWHIGRGSCPSDRLTKLDIKFKPQRKNGDHIILSEPTQYSIDYYKLDNWADKTINEIRKYSDRKIIIHKKGSQISLKDLLKNAWAFVSNHSNGGIISMIQGVPAYYTDGTLKKINSLENIEKGEIDYNIFSNLAYGQWTLAEIESGEAWKFLKEDSIQ